MRTFWPHVLMGILTVILFTGEVVCAVQPASTAAEIPEINTTSAADVFTYNPAGRRDPFAPLVYQIATVAPKIKRSLGPLEKFELNEFRLLAMMIVGGSPYAMVKAPDGKSYTVKVGDLMGPDGGVVKKIETKVFAIDEATGQRVEKSPDRIVVEETKVDKYTGKASRKDFYIEM